MGPAGHPRTRNSLIVFGLLALLTLLLLILLLGEPANPEIRDWIATHGLPRCGDASIYAWSCFSPP